MIPSHQLGHTLTSILEIRLPRTGVLNTERDSHGTVAC